MERDLTKRLMKFSVRVMKYMKGQPNYVEVKIIKNQVMRSASSAGANYVESQGGCTLKDFNYKISLALKEMRETSYWLSMFQDIRGGTIESRKLVHESIELTKILGSIYTKTRSG